MSKYSHILKKKKKKKRASNMSRLSYTKSLSLYFINSNTLATMNNWNHDSNQIVKQAKPNSVKKSTWNVKLSNISSEQEENLKTKYLDWTQSQENYFKKSTKISCLSITQGLSLLDA